MKRLALSASVILLGVLISLFGCPGISPDPDRRDAGAPRDAGDGGDAGDPFIEPQPEADSGSPYGLDTRPSNPTCAAPARPPDLSGSDAGVMFVRAFPNIPVTAPMVLLQAPGDASRVYLAERDGIIKSFPNNNGATAEQVSTFLDISSKVNTQVEGGFLGMAFHPKYATSRDVYVSYTTGSPPNPKTTQPLISRISRFHSNDDGKSLDPASEVVLLSLTQPEPNHNGGNIAFGPDGFLYIGFGDGGGGDDPRELAEKPTELFGKFLRIDVDGTSGALPYRIPPTNPYANATDGKRKEIYALGFRNPWRWSFDLGTGELWVGDVGQDRQEEIDKVVLGGNYGWDIREGTLCNEPATNCQTAGLIDPIFTYTMNRSKSITGGFVYRGSAIPSLVGKYVFGDFESKDIWFLSFDNSGIPKSNHITSAGNNPISFAQLEDGEIFVLRFGQIDKLVPKGQQPVDNFPKTLSATGCFKPNDPTQPAEGLIPYDINAALWSDGATKQRFMALPDGQKITVQADGDWNFPNGTVLIKNFALGSRRIETRLFMRHPDGTWGGYSYEWNDAQTEATLLPSSKTKVIDGKTWFFPSRADCLSCHTLQAGYSLGLETGQLNRSIQYPTTARTRNQLSTLEHIGLFAQPLGGDPSTLAKLPNPFGSETDESSVRAYLHANCSSCHRPNGTGRGPQDFRYGAPNGIGSYCNVNPTNGTLGVANAKIVAPGAPERSILSVRMHALDVNRMPPLATQVEDTQATARIDKWIRELSACP